MREALRSETAEAARLQAGIRALVRRFSVSERADVACCGVTVAQAAALAALGAGGPTRLRDLGRRLGITPSTLTRNLARLEASGLVEREGDPADARSFRVGLTAQGWRAARAVAAQEEDFARQVLARIPAARRAIVVESLGDLLGAVRAATEECCPGAFDHLMAGVEGGGERPAGADGAGCGASCGCAPGPAARRGARR
jgi:DNA-binding MarR family transcriptional regulator